MQQSFSFVDYSAVATEKQSICCAFT